MIRAYRDTEGMGAAGDLFWSRVLTAHTECNRIERTRVHRDTGPDPPDDWGL